MRNHKYCNAAFVSGTLFTFMTVWHLLRILSGVPATMGDMLVPASWNVLCMLVTFPMAAWNFKTWRLSKACCAPGQCACACDCKCCKDCQECCNEPKEGSKKGACC